MKRLWLFGALACLLLGSARPPGQAVSARPLLPYAVVDCVAGVVYSCAPIAPVLAEAPSAPIEAAVEVAAGRPDAVAPEQAADEPLDLVEAAPAPAEPDAGLRVVVSLPQQKAYVFRGGELVTTSRVSTGKPGHRTPVGTFSILQKAVHHHSSKYDNAPMPYMQRLTSYGIALHAGHVPGYPASHGCIRLPRSFAKKLYGLTDVGTKVTVTNQRPKSAEDALLLV
jgi:lipoprotein-anchoring transpeptidase ErfK/SrfK